ncbi:MAG: hypothetical protein AAF356_08260 [Planctomycetota bacterium]
MATTVEAKPQAEDLHHDLLRLLDLAEEIHEATERSARRIQHVRFMQLITVPLFVLLLGAIALIQESLDSLSLTTSIAIGLGCAGYMAITFLLLQRIANRYERWMQRDVNALHRLARLLHEYNDQLGGTAAWPPMRRAEFEIRLAKYDL